MLAFKDDVTIILLLGASFIRPPLPDILSLELVHILRETSKSLLIHCGKRFRFFML
jgi:hypothetical protein